MDRITAPERPSRRTPSRSGPQAFRLEPPSPTENDVQTTAHRWLEADRRVAWVVRCNNGAARDEAGNFFRFVRTVGGKGVPGWPDLVGQTVWGAFLAVECKAKHTDWRQPAWFERHLEVPDHLLGKQAHRLVSQARFLAEVRRHGGAAGVVWGVSAPEQLEAILLDGEAQYAGRLHAEVLSA